tara:strand:- start:118334 stop:118537 length:204 start_codon:yes stop_codon:yes gene_type:complete
MRFRFKTKIIAAINKERKMKGRMSLLFLRPKDLIATISESSESLFKVNIMANRADKGIAIGRKDTAI